MCLRFRRYKHVTEAPVINSPVIRRRDKAASGAGNTHHARRLQEMPSGPPPPLQSHTQNLTTPDPPIPYT